MNKTILVTGGAGYIGSHTTLALLQAGFEVVLDNLCNASAESLRRVAQLAPRRRGDIATCYADPTKAATELGWTAKRDLHTMMRDAWRWQAQNPDGYTVPRRWCVCIWRVGRATWTRSWRWRLSVVLL